VVVKEYVSPIMCLQLFGATNELDELGDFEYKLIEEECQEPVESRGIDFSHKVFKVLANAFELQRGKGGEDNAGGNKEAWHFSDIAGQWGSEPKIKRIEPHQR
jgi:hypothetical protein